ncbi:MAG: hypothetical protein QGH20_07270, partial [Candidatus Latescibacteria bacterium]|nr:hypothetical protein [Candidatus Latescibacterota bacterium]
MRKLVIKGAILVVLLFGLMGLFIREYTAWSNKAVQDMHLTPFDLDKVAAAAVDLRSLQQPMKAPVLENTETAALVPDIDRKPPTPPAPPSSTKDPKSNSKVESGSVGGWRRSPGQWKNPSVGRMRRDLGSWVDPPGQPIKQQSPDAQLPQKPQLSLDPPRSAPDRGPQKSEPSVYTLSADQLASIMVRQASLHPKAASLLRHVRGWSTSIEGGDLVIRATVDGNVLQRFGSRVPEAFKAAVAMLGTGPVAGIWRVSPIVENGAVVLTVERSHFTLGGISLDGRTASNYLGLP